MGEELIFSENGAINFFGSSSMTSPGNQMTLSVNFMNEMALLTKDYPKDQRVGDIVFKTQSTFPVNEGNRDVLLSWTFFGDPSMKMPVAAFSGTAPPQTASTPGSSDFGTVDGGGCGLIKGPPAGGPMNYLFIFFLLLPLVAWRKLKARVS